MAWYPFDQQTCLIEMITDGVLDNYADLVPGILDFSGKKELTQYFVKTFKISKDKIQAKKGVVISVTLGRRLLGTFLTIFFPTILLNVIGYSTNYFKEFFFEVSRQSHNSTISLVLLLGGDNCKPHIHVGVDNVVYQRE